MDQRYNSQNNQQGRNNHHFQQRFDGTQPSTSQDYMYPNTYHHQQQYQQQIPPFPVYHQQHRPSLNHHNDHYRPFQQQQQQFYDGNQYYYQQQQRRNFPPSIYYNQQQQANYYHPPPPHNIPPSTHHQQPSTHHQQPSSSNGNQGGGGGRSKMRFSKQRNNRDGGGGGGSADGSYQAPQTITGGGDDDVNGRQPIRFSHQRETTQQQNDEEVEEGEISTANNKSTSNKQHNSRVPSIRPFKKAKKDDRMQLRNYEEEVDGDQASVLQEQLTRGSYECMVCVEAVKQSHAIWSCHTCYHVFHIHCIKKWARSASAATQNEDGTNNGWLCPGCRSPNKKIPAAYFCFCGKQKNPITQKGDLPHSCGNICNRKRPNSTNCRHLCTNMCHPGPCPKCPAMITKKCRCGYISVKERCNQQKEHICAQVCGKLINCKLHKCKAICCPGNCDNCDVTIEQKCFCGKGTREIICGSDKHKESLKNMQEDGGSYSCEGTCDKLYPCGLHNCKSKCHGEECGSCLLSPQVVKTCPCTQTLIANIKFNGKYVERSKCTDHIPLCDKLCNKPLRCGGDAVHLCRLFCHHGECKPCKNGKTSVVCRCGKVRKDIPCKEYNETEEIKCDRRCNKKKTCGRHKCPKICCVDKGHICSQICDKKLTCGRHRCVDLCHRGKCHTCHNVSFDELTCYCGNEITYPPIHCGVQPPLCNLICSRVHHCSHPVRHTCHMEDNCPPCVELVKKTCNCGRLVRANIMCHITNVSCGIRCVKLLPCGHQCNKQCHQGECLSEGEKCIQQCTKKRKNCVHSCTSSCHVDTPCPDTRCQASVTCKCSCGRREQRLTCYEETKMKKKAATIANMRNLMKEETTQVDMSKLLSAPDNRNMLACDEECHVMERNRRMAAALSISPSRLSNPTEIYSQFLLDISKKEKKLIMNVENELKSLIESVRWLEYKSKSFSFPNMKKEKRRIVHELAEVFKCKSQSFDEEPRRYVCVTAFKDQSSEPNRLLSEYQPTSTSSQTPSTFGGSLVSSMKLVQFSSSSQSSTTKQEEEETQTTNPSSANVEMIDYFDFDG